MDEARLIKQIGFIIEIDKIKNIFRRTRLFDGKRYENDAEHSWHLAIMALILHEYADADIDLIKVLKMVLIHDLVEIDAGDTFLYGDQTDKSEKEDNAAKRIFGLLPKDQGDELYNIWLEFEERKTNEARFAGALDRLEPVMQNYFNNGHAWKKHNISSKQVMEKNSIIESGSKALWDYAKSLIEECIDKDYIK